ncbi:hypothetical protein P7C70_g5348, partial [Phenoliferia sp. Uapishka_3]
MLKLLSLIALLASVVALPANSLANSTEIEWISCAENTPQPLQGLIPNATLASLPLTLSCGHLPVPIDWSQPISENNSMAVAFAKYSPPNAVGNLFFCPGGPGQESASNAWEVALGTTNLLEGLESFNITMMDIRGSYQSNAINCSAAVYGAIPQDFPTSQDEFDALKEASAAWTATCTPADLIPFLSTEHVAQDFEALRVALKAGKSHYLGVSYGSFYGAEWASRFPEALERLVFDGIFGHGLNNSQLVGYGVRAANRELVRADANCQYNTSCPFHSQGKGSIIVVCYFALHYQAFQTLNMLQQAYNQLLTNLTAMPMQASACLNTTSCFTPVTARNFEDGVYSYLFNNPDYDLLFTGLAAALEGDASYFARQELAIEGFDSVTGLLCADVEWATDSFYNTPNSYLVVRHGDVHTSFGFIDVPASAARDIGISYLANGTLPPAQNSSEVAVYTPGTKRAPIADPYSAPQGIAAGDYPT